VCHKAYDRALRVGSGRQRKANCDVTEFVEGFSVTENRDYVSCPAAVAGSGSFVMSGLCSNLVVIDSLHPLFESEISTRWQYAPT
jgi:hypothetical protein